MLRLAPMAIELLAFAAIYRVVPHRTIKWRHAVAGALLAVFLFEAIKWGISLYLGSFGSYSKIYGTLAFVPIFLLWIYLSWTAVLLGASLASSISAFRYQPAHMRLPHGYEMYGLLRLVARFNEARKHGRGLHSDQIQQLEPMLTDALVQEMLAQLCQINLLRRAEDGEWLLSRDLDDLALAELYEACQLRIPIAEAHLPCREDSLGHAATAAIDELRIPLRDLLKRRVGSIHAVPPATRTDSMPRSAAPAAVVDRAVARGLQAGTARRAGHHAAPTTAANRAAPSRSRRSRRRRRPRRRRCPRSASPPSTARSTTWPHTAASGWCSTSGRPGARRA